MAKTATAFYEQLLLPAAAGNVAWSVLSVGLAKTPPSEFVSRLALLALLAGYLIAEWLRQSPVGNTARYWWFSGLHVLGIIALSIATAQEHCPHLLAWLLAGTLAITAVGHHCSAWGTDQTANRLHAIPSWLGVGALVIAVLKRDLPGSLVPVPIAAAIAFVAWLGILFLNLPREKTAPEKPAPDKPQL